MTQELVGWVWRSIFEMNRDTLMNSKTIEGFWEARGGAKAYRQVLLFLDRTEDDLTNPPVVPTETEEEEM